MQLINLLMGHINNKIDFYSSTMKFIYSLDSLVFSLWMVYFRWHSKTKNERGETEGYSQLLRFLAFYLCVFRPRFCFHFYDSWLWWHLYGHPYSVFFCHFTNLIKRNKFFFFLAYQKVGEIGRESTHLWKIICFFK